MSLLAWSTDEAHYAIPIDLSVYSLPAVLRSAYKMSDRVCVYLQRDEENAEKLWAYFFARSASSDVKPLAVEFFGDLADQQLRVHLDDRFRDVRALIVAQAFSEGNLLNPDDEHADYRTDPHGAAKCR